MNKLNNFKIEYLFSYDVAIGDMYQMHNSPFGMRNIGYITSGRIWGGERIRGRILPGGGDWCVIRRDGISMPDVKLMIETDTGAHILMTYTGKMDTGENGYENYCAGRYPDVNYITTNVQFETEDADYLWVNRVSCFGIGQVDRTANPLKVQYDVYAFRSLPDEA